MLVLVINAGSTSLKADVFRMPEEDCVASATVRRIGRPGAVLELRGSGGPSTEEREIADHAAALRCALDSMLGDPGELAVGAVGHRVVHGGETLGAPAIVDQHVEQVIAEHARFAPLHNPANLSGIRAARARLPDVPHVAVTDTGFHRTLPREAYVYGIPYELYEEHGVRRYGFHGTSHQYVAAQAAARLGKPLEELRLITCHLGGGASVCAVDRGRSVDTSMGMTPLEGLLMGTRSGDLDPGVVLYLQERLSLSVRQIDDLLNRDSGLMGISGVSRDMRELLALADDGHARAELAVRVFCRRVRHYVGAYVAQLGGAHAVVFTGGIGENSPVVRERICTGLDAIGIEIDRRRNAEATGESVVSTSGSRIALLVVPTDEELQIARAVCATIG